MKVSNKKSYKTIKYLSLSLIVISLFLLTLMSGCASSEANENVNSANENSNKVSNTEDVTEIENNNENTNTASLLDYDTDSKVLIAYFSVTQYTEQKAMVMDELIDADLFRIEPVEEYTTEDLDYENPDSRTSIETQDLTILPEIADKVENWDDYSVVFLGYPLWNKQAPNIIYNFVQSYDWSGKTIIPFCTSSRNAIGNSAVNLEPYAKGDPTWIEGKRFSQSTDEERIRDWLKSLGFHTKRIRD